MVVRPQGYALNRLRIGSASTLLAGGDVSERVTQREVKRKSDACRVNNRSSAEEVESVCSKLAAGKGLQRQSGKG